ncbi:unnamed protein product [Arabidopsis lyrata]|nr:unnamed protein product [Arabidopsis lyrata]
MHLCIMKQGLQFPKNQFFMRERILVIACTDLSDKLSALVPTPKSTIIESFCPSRYRRRRKFSLSYHSIGTS